MAFFQAHFLDADFAVGQFLFAKDNSEGDGALFGGFELLRELGLDFVGVFGLISLVLHYIAG